MSKITLSSNASGTGTLTIASPNTSTDRTLTLPDETGTVLSTATAGVPIGGPAFSAYGATATTLVTGVNTKITLDAELFDTNSNFASSRFTPTVAGYYQINGVASYTTGAAGSASNWVSIYKNGVEYGRWSRQLLAASVAANPTCSAVIYLNGSTDYAELYAFTNGGTVVSDAGQYSQMSGALVRSAT